MGKTILALVAGVLCGCVDMVVVQDPTTGQTAQCTADVGFPLLAAHHIDSCVAAYERMGWRRQ